MKQILGIALLSLLLGCHNKVVRTDVQSFGDRQLAQLLEDRQDMQDVVMKEGPLWDWVTSAFDGELTGSRIYWNADSPVSGRSAEHLPSYGRYPAAVYISGGTEASPIDKWSSLVFELNNISCNDISELYAEALQGKHTAESFARECVRNEFEALKATRELLRKHPISRVKPRRDAWYTWVTEDLPTFEEYGSMWEDNNSPSESNFAYFEEYFRNRIEPSLPKRSQKPESPSMHARDRDSH